MDKKCVRILDPKNSLHKIEKRVGAFGNVHSCKIPAELVPVWSHIHFQNVLKFQVWGMQFFGKKSIGARGKGKCCSLQIYIYFHIIGLIGSLCRKAQHMDTNSLIEVIIKTTVFLVCARR